MPSDQDDRERRSELQGRLLELVGQPVIALDANHRVTLWNRGAERVLGWTYREVVGETILDKIVPRENQSDALVLREAMMAKGTWHGELPLLTKDGRTLILQGQVQIIPDELGGGRICTGLDVTELRRAEREREEALARARFQAELLDAVGQSVIATDLEGRVTYWNRASERIYGWSAEEAMGRPIVELTPTEMSKAQAEEIMAAITNGQMWSGEFELKRKSGERFVGWVTNAAIRGRDGESIGVVGVSSDLSEQKALEAQLRQAQKMEAIGRLAGGIAHDFNNLLTAIQGNVELALSATEVHSPVAEDLLEIRRSADRAAALTRQLLAFSRKQLLQERTIDLAEEIGEMWSILRRLIPESIELSITTEGGALLVRADPTQIHQVVLNLAVNAADAMGGKGSLTIHVEPVTLSTEDVAEIPWHVLAGDYVALEVRDTGSGMPRDVQERIFEPFFTTKDAGKGTGLGLSTVYGIVKQSAGHILVESEEGKGTLFRVLLPRRQGSETSLSLEPRPSRPSPARGTETILLVEDDAAVRRATRRMLSRAGHDVLCAENGRVAIDIAQSHGASIHLVVSDVVMPEMGGLELVRSLREHHPDLRVVLTSGYATDALDGHLDELGAAQFVPKPFSTDQLFEAIRKALKGRRRKRER